MDGTVSSFGCCLTGELLFLKLPTLLCTLDCFHERENRHRSCVCCQNSGCDAVSVHECVPSFILC